MQLTLMILTALHVLPAIFWAGTTFVLARAAWTGAEQLAFPQIGAAAATVIAGTVLWGLLHAQSFGTTEGVLAIGVASALTAAGLQGLSLPIIRRLRAASPADAAALRHRIATTQRAAAGLLAVAIVCMAVSRYA